MPHLVRDIEVAGQEGSYVYRGCLDCLAASVVESVLFFFNIISFL